MKQLYGKIRIVTVEIKENQKDEIRDIKYEFIAITKITLEKLLPGFSAKYGYTFQLSDFYALPRGADVSNVKDEDDMIVVDNIPANQEVFRKMLQKPVWITNITDKNGFDAPIATVSTHVRMKGITMSDLLIIDGFVSKIYDKINGIVPIKPKIKEVPKIEENVEKGSELIETVDGNSSENEELNVDMNKQVSLKKLNNVAFSKDKAKANYDLFDEFMSRNSNNLSVIPSDYYRTEWEAYLKSSIILKSCVKKNQDKVNYVLQGGYLPAHYKLEGHNVKDVTDFNGCGISTYMTILSLNGKEGLKRISEMSTIISDALQVKTELELAQMIGIAIELNLNVQFVVDSQDKEHKDEIRIINVVMNKSKPNYQILNPNGKHWSAGRTKTLELILNEFDKKKIKYNTSDYVNELNKEYVIIDNNKLIGIVSSLGDLNHYIPLTDGFITEIDESHSENREEEKAIIEKVEDTVDGTKLAKEKIKIKEDKTFNNLGALETKINELILKNDRDVTISTTIELSDLISYLSTTLFDIDSAFRKDKHTIECRLMVTKINLNQKRLKYNKLNTKEIDLSQTLIQLNNAVFGR